MMTSTSYSALATVALVSSARSIRSPFMHARLAGSGCVGQNSCWMQPRHFCSETVRSFPAGSGRSSTLSVALNLADQRGSRHGCLLQSWLTDSCQKPYTPTNTLCLYRKRSGEVLGRQRPMARQGAVSDSVVATVTFMLASSILMGIPASRPEKALRKLRNSAPVLAAQVQLTSHPCADRLDPPKHRNDGAPRSPGPCGGDPRETRSAPKEVAKNTPTTWTVKPDLK